MWQKGWMEGKEFTGEGNYSLLLGRKKHELKTRETKRKKKNQNNQEYRKL